jgi:hypothetical protein
MTSKARKKLKEAFKSKNSYHRLSNISRFISTQLFEALLPSREELEQLVINSNEQSIAQRTRYASVKRTTTLVTERKHNTQSNKKPARPRKYSQSRSSSSKISEGKCKNSLVMAQSLDVPASKSRNRSCTASPKYSEETNHCEVDVNSNLYWVDNVDFSPAVEGVNYEYLRNALKNESRENFDQQRGRDEDLYWQEDLITCTNNDSIESKY